MESLKTILYFSIFRYPLNLEEIHSYTNNSDQAITLNEIEQLVTDKILTKIDDFYVYANDLESVTKRLKGNIQAPEAMIIAKKRAKFIAKFPFVKAVGVSGSLSKGYFDKDSDIDFFVITKHNKLWICRTFLMVYKKIFLLNSKKYFCINYFISERKLQIKEQNRFTATELKTLIPLQGKAVFEEFYAENNWIKNYFSKFSPSLSLVEEFKKPKVSGLTELLLENTLGEFMDVTFKKITFKKWELKFKHLHLDDFKIALKTTKNISKHHPSNFQKKVIMALNEKIEEVKSNFNISLPLENV